MQALILAGGKGTRLGLRNMPKAMVKIGGIPILQHQVELLRRYGITDITICVEHLSEAIKEYFGTGKKFGVNIAYSEEKEPLGTAGAVKFAEKRIKGDFIVFYCDVMLGMDLAKLVRYHKKKGGEATLVLHKSDHPYDSDIVRTDSRGRVKKFMGKPKPGQKFRNLTNAAVYVMKMSVMKHIRPGYSDFGRDVFPRLVENGVAVHGYVTAEYAKDIGTRDRLEKVRGDYAAGKIIRKMAVFLDRDGVITEDANLLFKPSQVKLIKGAAEGIRMLNENGLLAIVVTNQPVVARGMCTEDDLFVIHKRLEKLLERKKARLDAIYYCPHHPDKGYPEENPAYKVICECRKPKPGMLLRAAKDFSLNLRECFMIGDKTTDIKAGSDAGCITILLKTGSGGTDGIIRIKPRHVCKNLPEAAKLIIKTHKPR
jgi:D,D-heptose 1,7-bisphosphate phosphatase